MQWSGRRTCARFETTCRRSPGTQWDVRAIARVSRKGLSWVMSPRRGDADTVGKGVPRSSLSWYVLAPGPPNAHVWTPAALVLWDWYRATLSPGNMALDERGGPPAQAGGGLRRTGRTAEEHDPRGRSRDPLIGAVAFSIVAPPWVNLVVPLLESGANE